MPSTCPVCHYPLVNDYVPNKDQTERLVKKCTHMLNHKLIFGSHYKRHDEITMIELHFDFPLIINWGYIDEQLTHCYLTKGPITTDNLPMPLPNFEPDFSDYKKLVNKIKTYMVFS